MKTSPQVLPTPAVNGAGRTTYYGALVRIQSRGLGLDGCLAVQRANDLTGGWIDDQTFDQSSDYCYSEAKSHASALAARLWTSRKSH